MAALEKLTFEFQLPRYQPFCDQSKPPWTAGERKLVLPWSWPRNLYLVVTEMLAVKGEAAGSGVAAAGACGPGAAGGVVWAWAAMAARARADANAYDVFFMERAPGAG